MAASVQAFDINEFRGAGLEASKSRYDSQMKRIRDRGHSTAEIASAVEHTIANLREQKSNSFVIYGEPQSGKTEMMICITASLLDHGHKVIVVLVNDSVQLLEQNLSRFQRSGIDPAPKNFNEILDDSVRLGER